MTRADIKTQYPYVRSELAVKLGISCNKLGELKDKVLETPADWLRVGKGYRVSEQGYTKLVQWIENESVEVGMLKQTASALVLQAEAISVMPPVVTAHAIKVTRRALNPRIVLGELDGKSVRVMVRSNENFKPGMVVPAIPIDAAGGLYRLNRNAPRWLGRW